MLLVVRQHEARLFDGLGGDGDFVVSAVLGMLTFRDEQFHGLTSLWLQSMAS